MPPFPPSVHGVSVDVALFMKVAGMVEAGLMRLHGPPLPCGAMFKAPDGMEGIVRSVQLDPAGVLGYGQAGAPQLRAVFLGGLQKLVGFSRRILLETALPDGGL